MPCQVLSGYVASMFPDLRLLSFHTRENRGFSIVKSTQMFVAYPFKVTSTDICLVQKNILVRRSGESSNHRNGYVRDTFIRKPSQCI